MLEEKDVKDEMRLSALELVAELSMALACKALGFGPEGVRYLNKTILEGLGQETFEGEDPALSDLLSSEHQAAVARLLEGVESRHLALSLMPR